MHNQKVFIIWTNPLFHTSVVLLLDNPQIEVVGETSNYPDAWQQISLQRPDTILIEKTSAGVPAEVLDILENSSWKVRVIGLSLANNELSIYHREQQTVGQIADLLRFILSEPQARRESTDIS
ncbi:MAG: hypothetical protein JSV61_01520 [Anaerolineales bacterium]|nr:MAG: hypothetical protein JSV61_01520 [Anaerolineales bacterium]